MFPSQIAGMTAERVAAAVLGRAALRRLAVHHASTSRSSSSSAYFYTAIQFNPTDVADNLKKQNASIPGIRPGKRTAEYIDYVLDAADLRAAPWYISAVCVLPTLLQTQVRRAVLLRRHVAAHRGRRRARHRPADREPPGDAHLRGLRRAPRATHPRPTGVSGASVGARCRMNARFT